MPCARKMWRNMLASLQPNALSRGPNDLSHVSFKDRISYSGPGARRRRWPLTTRRGLSHPLEALDYEFGISLINMADAIVLIHLLFISHLGEIIMFYCL